MTVEKNQTGVLIKKKGGDYFLKMKNVNIFKSLSITTMISTILFFCTNVMASNTDTTSIISSSVNFYGIFCLSIFIIAYILVALEEYIQLSKSKPVLIASSIIWIIIAAFASPDDFDKINKTIQHSFLEFGELCFFLIVAMTYINTMNNRNIFKRVRYSLSSTGLGFGFLFWTTGVMSFLMSPIADNLTTALVMCAVVMAAAKDNIKFISLACVNIVVAANAGGAFSPFGDITTLMVWQKGLVDFWNFFYLFIPSLINWLVPAIIMFFFLPKNGNKPKVQKEKVPKIKKGGLWAVNLFILTIITTVSLHVIFHTSASFGMMTGLGYLFILSYIIKKKDKKKKKFNIFKMISKCEWDTLFFFYGVIMCVSGLAYLGYLLVVSNVLYTDLGPTEANIILGVLSAIIDNIPVMFAILSMNPDMVLGQWLLVTLTVGVGGSLLSIGSAAGVALMGQSKGAYTFFGHLKWTPIIALGYIAGIYTHIYLNKALF